MGFYAESPFAPSGAALPGRCPCCAAAIALNALSRPCYNEGFLLLGGRSTVGHVALDHVIGVRIPASQPYFVQVGRLAADVPEASAQTGEGRLADPAQRAEGDLINPYASRNHAKLRLGTEPSRRTPPWAPTISLR
jgi:hypothetical protein